jgi:hypothetical protein
VNREEGTRCIKMNTSLEAACGEDSEGEEECKEVVKMNMSCKDAQCIKNEVYQ